VRRYDTDSDAYELEFADNEWHLISFEDTLKLIPKSWQKADAEANFCAVFDNLNAAVFNAKTMPPPAAKQAEYTTPKTPAEARKNWDWHLWEPAFDKEFYVLDQEKGCWVVVDIDSMPPDANLIDCKWVCKVKYQSGVYEKHRARIVALGYQQKKGIDYFENFSPTASQTSIRLLLALTAIPGFRTDDFDVTCAFISAVLGENEKIYMRAPPGYPLPEGKVYRLVKTIYGLVQAPRQYFLLAKEIYDKVGLKQLMSDECVFVNRLNHSSLLIVGELLAFIRKSR
jgi:hypothetical protein